MEGHETSDWNSYYADTQEVSELRVRCPSEREKRGPGEGRGAEGGSESGDRFALRLPPAPSRLSSAKPPEELRTAGRRTGGAGGSAELTPENSWLGAGDRRVAVPLPPAYGTGTGRAGPRAARSPRPPPLGAPRCWLLPGPHLLEPREKKGRKKE